MKENSLNLFQDIPDSLEEELVQRILENNSVRIERIASKGHVSAPDFWYDQEEHEWVVVLTGKASLQIDGREDQVRLGPGDTCFLPAHVKHRVEWTDPVCATIWLAVFWAP